jgi:hypothetical protein
MLFLPQVACQNFAALPGKEGGRFAKNFSSQVEGFALQFPQMKYPASSGKLVSSTIIFPGRPFQATILNTSHL